MLTERRQIPEIGLVQMMMHIIELMDLDDSRSENNSADRRTKLDTKEDYPGPDREIRDFEHPHLQSVPIHEALRNLNHGLP